MVLWVIGTKLGEGRALMELSSNPGLSYCYPKTFPDLEYCRLAMTQGSSTKIIHPEEYPPSLPRSTPVSWYTL